MEVLSTCTAATVERGGATTHHHAVGHFPRPFYDGSGPSCSPARCAAPSASSIPRE